MLRVLPPVYRLKIRCFRDFVHECPVFRRECLGQLVVCRSLPLDKPCDVGGSIPRQMQEFTSRQDLTEDGSFDAG